MQCSETDSRIPAVRVPMPLDLAKDISYWLNAIKDAGGNGRILLDVSGGNVVSTELSIKRARKKSA